MASTTVIPHPDDLAVLEFSGYMLAKMRWEREARGRHGWQTMDAETLSRLLREHLDKGDPVDIANFAMMLHQNGQRYVPEAL